MKSNSSSDVPSTLMDGNGFFDGFGYRFEMISAPLVLSARSPRRAALSFILIGFIQFHDQVTTPEVYAVQTMMDTAACGKRRYEFRCAVAYRVHVDVRPMGRAASRVVENNNRILDEVIVDVRVEDLRNRHLRARTTAFIGLENLRAVPQRNSSIEFGEPPEISRSSGGSPRVAKV